MRRLHCKKTYLAFRNKGVLFLGVFVISEEDKIKKFVEAYHLTFPVGKESGIATELNVKELRPFLLVGMMKLSTVTPFP